MNVTFVRLFFMEGGIFAGMVHYVNHCNISTNANDSIETTNMQTQKAHRRSGSGLIENQALRSSVQHEVIPVDPYVIIDAFPAAAGV